MNGNETKRHYLLPGGLFAHECEHLVTTVLGSCISVCLWDPVQKIGGINHFMLPLWNGEGLASPRYGNIAIAKLIQKVTGLGADQENIRAKIFGGGDVLTSNGFISIGQRNIELARDLLSDAKIPIVSADTGGKNGRKLLFNTGTGVVLIKLLKKQIDDIRL